MASREVLREEFKRLLQENIRNINEIVRVAEKAHFTDEQFYIEWEDYLNYISVKDHSK